MTPQEAKKMLEAKLKCLIAETSGTNHDCNMRLCDGCPLNYEQGNMGEQKQTLDMAIKALEQQPCEDCISRTEVLDIINFEDEWLFDANSHNADTKIAFSTIKSKISEMPSVTPNARWIPCSDKMPDINIHVLAQFVMGGMAECYYAHNWWHIVGGFRISGDEVIAWMPLPEPYKEENKTKQGLAYADQDTLMSAT